MKLHGINKMNDYRDRDGVPSYEEIAKTGANACGIFWFTRNDATANEIDVTIKNCLAQNMVPYSLKFKATASSMIYREGECVTAHPRGVVFICFRVLMESINI